MLFFYLEHDSLCCFKEVPRSAFSGVAGSDPIFKRCYVVYFTEAVPVPVPNFWSKLKVTINLKLKNNEKVLVLALFYHVTLRFQYRTVLFSRIGVPGSLNRDAGSVSCAIMLNKKNL